MEKSSKSLLLATIAIATGLGVAQVQAQDASEQGHKGMDFATLDADGSGEITAEDLDALREARFAEIDTNGDGLVSEAEFAAHASAQAAERASEMFARLDSDGDGTVSRETLEARQMRGNRMSQRFLNRADTDDSGGVSEEEFLAMQEKFAERRGGKDGKKKRSN